jgi:hypothetical protein
MGIEEDHIVSRWIRLREMQEQVVDIATDPRATVAFAPSEQMGVDTDPLAGT